MNLWIVNKYIGECDKGRAVEFQGVFDSEEKAIAACRDEFYCIGAAKLNQEWSNETVEWPGAYYPLADKVKEASNGPTA